MTAQQSAAPAAARSGTPSKAAVDALVDNLLSETRLIDELSGLMRRQRTAVAGDDLQAVDDSVYGTQRVLLTLGEARRRRRSLNRLIGNSEELGLRALEDALGSMMTDSVRHARDGLQAAALTLSQEVDVNRRVLKEALAAGDEYVRTLFGAPEPLRLYTAGATGAPSTDERTGGLLINRQA